MAQLSKSSIDRLGERLSASTDSEADLVLLDEYRRSFNEAYLAVVEFIRRDLGLQPTGRPAKSTLSIRAKLRRESVRLTQMQDVAGCRLVVESLAEQQRIATRLNDAFSGSVVFDRRQRPSHGYRAVHVVVKARGRYVEVQIRTSLQHVWAELSEKLADVFGIEVKYGGGPANVRRTLDMESQAIAGLEVIESGIDALQADAARDPESDAEVLAEIARLKIQVSGMRRELLQPTIELIQSADGLIEAKRALRPK